MTVLKRSVDIKFWIGLAGSGVFYIFGAGVFYQTVQAHATTIKKLEVKVEKLTEIQSQQHTIQSVQSAQMEWIIEHLKKKGS